MPEGERLRRTLSGEPHAEARRIVSSLRGREVDVSESDVIFDCSV
jgi:acetolactate synthase small subunit